MPPTCVAMGYKRGFLSWASRRSIRLFLLLLLGLVAVVTIQTLTHVMGYSLLLPSTTREQEAGQGEVSFTAEASKLSDVKQVMEHNTVQQNNDHSTRQKDGHHMVPPKSNSQNSTWEDLESRKRQAESVCKTTPEHTSKPWSHVHNVLANRPHKLAYCLVPKTGCTFWKQIFFFINNSTGMKTPVASPFDIPRLHLHLQNPHSVPPDSVQDYTKFMFSRDPYSRLWSAYLDKFYLPDFWIQFGIKVLKRRQTPPDSHTLNCGMNISFPEFIDFTLAVPEVHWNPISTQCDPCQFQPQVLGRMETFTRDAKVVLQSVGLDWILRDFDHHTHVQHELEMLIHYNFQVIYNKTPVLAQQNCIKDEQLGQRLWTTFQYNGYIPGNIPYSPPNPFSQEAFKDKVLEAFAQSQAYGKDRLRRQKKQALENAFSQLSNSTLQKLAKKYSRDFEMFGYSPRFV